MNNNEFCEKLAALRLRMETERQAVIDLCNEVPAAIAGRASYIADRIDAVLNEVDDVAAFARK